MRGWLPTTMGEGIALACFPLILLIACAIEFFRRREPYDYYAEVLKRQ